MLSDSWWYFQQVDASNFYLPPGGQCEKHLRWYVPNTARVSTPTGLQPVHDDSLISAALVAAYDDLFLVGTLSLGLAKSSIIPPIDPLKDITF